MNQGIQARELSRLAGELAFVPPSQCEDVLRYALERMTHLIGATNGYWVAAAREDAPRRDRMQGWRVRDFHYLHDREAMLRDGIELARRVNAGNPDPSTEAIVARSGKTRAYLRPELVDDRTWSQSWITNDYLHPRGIHDQLLSVCAVSPRFESYFCFTRGRSDHPFSARDRDALLWFMEDSTAFHRSILALRGVAASEELTLRERELLALLLTDMSEMEIARNLGIGARTVHQHAVAIYRKMACRGRQSLMARFLRGEISAESD